MVEYISIKVKYIIQLSSRRCGLPRGYWPGLRGRCLWSTEGSGRIGFRSRFSQCVNYIRFNGKWSCFRWQEVTKLYLFGHNKTSNLVVLYDLRDLTGNISSIMTTHMGYFVGYIALLISLAKAFYAFNHDLLMLFSRSILVPFHQHQR